LQSLVVDILSLKGDKGGWTKKRNWFQVQKITPDFFKVMGIKLGLVVT
jgi:hypothetical protein